MHKKILSAFPGLAVIVLTITGCIIVINGKSAVPAIAGYPHPNHWMQKSPAAVMFTIEAGRRSIQRYPAPDP